jgi:hypothetical protein
MKARATAAASIGLLLAASFFLIRAVWDVCAMFILLSDRTRIIIVEPWWFSGRFETTVAAFYAAVALRRIISRRTVLPVVLTGIVVFLVGGVLYAYSLLPYYFFASLVIHLTIAVILIVRDCIRFFHSELESLSLNTRNA